MKEPRKRLARQSWVSACEFDAASDVLTKIETNTLEQVAEGAKAYVLLDLDSTLYEVAPRTVRIFKEAVRVLDTEIPAPVRQAFEGLGPGTAGYSLQDTWQNLGLCMKDPTLCEARDNLEAFWSEKFFSNEFLTEDVPYPGTAAFVRNLHALGASLVYLTGRDLPRMGEGTLECLKRDGFPIGVERTELRMKASHRLDDVFHKVGIAEALAKQGTVVASFENEPRNFAALAKALPDAIHVFVDTICSNKPAPAVRGAYRLQRWQPQS
jgi:beta-phosphoglucomutase-like phosphatase (HAD superfamily)